MKESGRKGTEFSFHSLLLSFSFLSLLFLFPSSLLFRSVCFDSTPTAHSSSFPSFGVLLPLLSSFPVGVSSFRVKGERALSLHTILPSFYSLYLLFSSLKFIPSVIAIIVFSLSLPTLLSSVTFHSLSVFVRHPASGQHSSFSPFSLPQSRESLQKREKCVSIPSHSTFKRPVSTHGEEDCNDPSLIPEVFS